MKKRRKTSAVQKAKHPTGQKAFPVNNSSDCEQRMQQWLDQMEQLRLSEYLRYVGDRRTLFWNSFLSGIARGVGTAIGFTILSAILILFLQDLARHNLPLIGEWLDKLMHVIQNGIN